MEYSSFEIAIVVLAAAVGWLATLGEALLVGFVAINCKNVHPLEYVIAVPLILGNAVGSLVLTMILMQMTQGR